MTRLPLAPNCPLYYQVYVCKSRALMHDTIAVWADENDAPKSAKDRDCRALFVGWTRRLSVKRFKTGPKTCVGALFFSAADMGAGIISHEAFHALSCTASIAGLTEDTLFGKDEEHAANTIGWYARGINNAGIAARKWFGIRHK